MAQIKTNKIIWNCANIAAREANIPDLFKTLAIFIQEK